MTKEVFEERIQAQRGRMMALARTKLPESDCEDAVQNAIVSAWIHLPQLKDEEKFDAWIHQILRNECMQILRTRKRQIDTQKAAVQASGMTPDSAVPPVYAALEELHPQERRLLLMHHDQGYTVREMSHTLGTSEDIVKMRLYRARNRLRVILVSLLILLLSLAIAVGTGYLDITWFLQNRRAEPQTIDTDYRSVGEISCTSRFLACELSDAIWRPDTLELMLTYSFAGVDNGCLITHSGNIGVDGKRQDHIWINDAIFPVADWADGKTVLTYFLSGWRIGHLLLRSSEDYLQDGKGDTFFASLCLEQITPQQYEMLLTDEGHLVLETGVFISDYASGAFIEQSQLTMIIDAPTAEQWRTSYETYFR